MVKISIITAVYNTAKYLPQCIESVVNQSLKPEEFIIVDDGSNDGSALICDEYSQKFDFIKVIHQTNAGQAVARNKGLQIAQGDLICFLDSDDWLDSNFLATMATACLDNHADVVCTSMSDNYASGAVIRHIYPTDSNPYQISPSVCNKMFRAKLIADLKFPANLWYEDLGFFHTLLIKKPRIVYTDATTYNCNCRQISTMNNNNAHKNLDILTIFDFIFQQRLLAGQTLDEYEFVLIDTLLITTINRLARMNNKEKNQVIAKVRKYVQTKFPHWVKSKSFRKLPWRRRLIALLNGYGWHNISRSILYILQKIRQH